MKRDVEVTGFPGEECSGLASHLTTMLEAAAAASASEHLPPFSDEVEAVTSRPHEETEGSPLLPATGPVTPLEETLLELPRYCE